MINNKYSTGYYVIVKDTNLCDLYNKTTDSLILHLATENEIKSFLTINCPDHPFLNLDKNVCDTLYLTDYDYTNYNSASSIAGSQYFNSGSYCYDLSGYEKRANEIPEQLEFNFDYEDDRLFPEDDIDLPYLGDNEDWYNKYIGNINSQPSPQSLAGFFIL